MKIDHIGYAVKNTKEAIIILQKMGYEFSETRRDEDRGVDVTIGELNGLKIEVLSPPNFLE